MKTNIFIKKDNLEALREIPDDAIDLVYADPPFNIGRDFSDGQGGYTDRHAVEKAEDWHLNTESSNG